MARSGSSSSNTTTPDPDVKNVIEDVAKTGTVTPVEDESVDTNPANVQPEVPGLDVEDDTNGVTDAELEAMRKRIDAKREQLSTIRNQIHENAMAKTRAQTELTLKAEEAAIDAEIANLVTAANDQLQVSPGDVVDAVIVNGDTASLRLAIANQIAQEAAVAKAEEENPGVKIETVHPKDDPLRQVLVDNGLVTKEGKLKAEVRRLFDGGSN